MNLNISKEMSSYTICYIITLIEVLGYVDYQSAICSTKGCKLNFTESFNIEHRPVISALIVYLNARWGFYPIGFVKLIKCLPKTINII